MKLPAGFAEVLPILFPLLFVGFWLIVTRSLRRMARMHRELPFDPGPPLRESRWGSGAVNGVSMQNCLKISEHVGGWMLRTMWIFGGGRIWLPRESVQLGEVVPRRFLLPMNRTLFAGEEQVRLFGPLAEFVSSSYGEAPSPDRLL